MHFKTFSTTLPDEGFLLATLRLRGRCSRPIISQGYRTNVYRNLDTTHSLLTTEAQGFVRPWSFARRARILTGLKNLILV
jgi:hypothetical protein